MSNNCVQCGISIPDSQTICSMCYGDIDYGTDGYYRREYEQQERIQEQPQEEKGELIHATKEND